MDPIAICGSALHVLGKIKEQLKDCEASFEAAVELNAMLEVFEVTITMVCTHEPPNVEYINIVCVFLRSFFTDSGKSCIKRRSYQRVQRNGGERQ